MNRFHMNSVDWFYLPTTTTKMFLPMIFHSPSLNLLFNLLWKVFKFFSVHSWIFKQRKKNIQIDDKKLKLFLQVCFELVDFTSFMDHEFMAEWNNWKRKHKIPLENLFCLMMIQKSLPIQAIWAPSIMMIILKCKKMSFVPMWMVDTFFLLLLSLF